MIFFARPCRAATHIARGRDTSYTAHVGSGSGLIHRGRVMLVEESP
jgi:hypothetical protein